MCGRYYIMKQIYQVLKDMGVDVQWNQILLGDCFPFLTYIYPVRDTSGFRVAARNDESASPPPMRTVSPRTRRGGQRVQAEDLFA